MQWLGPARCPSRVRLPAGRLRICFTMRVPLKASHGTYLYLSIFPCRVRNAAAPAVDCGRDSSQVVELHGRHRAREQLSGAHHWRHERPYTFVAVDESGHRPRRCAKADQSGLQWVDDEAHAQRFQMARGLRGVHRQPVQSGFGKALHRASGRTSPQDRFATEWKLLLEKHGIILPVR
jgi:hypothetical protein